jgi:predicted lipid-binding transport protein (Tim44 family)
MLFGGPFMGPGMMDILLIVGGIWLLMRFLKSRRPAQEGPSMHGANRFEETRSGNSAWDHLRSPAGGATHRAGSAYPPGFDEHEFLDGAKAAFTRLQQSWDTRDLADIRRFTSDEVYAEIEKQAKEDPTPGRTDILLLQAFLQDVRTLGNQTVATVLFEGTMREDARTDRTEEIREIWHFSRYESGGSSHWVVEGLQQTS